MKNLFGEEVKPTEEKGTPGAVEVLLDYEMRVSLLLKVLNPTLRLSEVAKLLGISESSVRYYARKGELRCYTTDGGRGGSSCYGFSSFSKRSSPKSGRLSLPPQARGCLRNSGGIMRIC
jgi:hypothetical protein